MKNRKISPSSNDGRAPRQRGSGAKIPSETKKTPKLKKLFKIAVVTFSRAEFVFLCANFDEISIKINIFQSLTLKVQVKAYCGFTQSKRWGHFANFFLQQMFFWGTKPFALGASLCYVTFA